MTTAIPMAVMKGITDLITVPETPNRTPTLAAPGE